MGGCDRYVGGSKETILLPDGSTTLYTAPTLYILHGNAGNIVPPPSKAICNYRRATDCIERRNSTDTAAATSFSSNTADTAFPRALRITAVFSKTRKPA